MLDSSLSLLQSILLWFTFSFLLMVNFGDIWSGRIQNQCWHSDNMSFYNNMINKNAHIIPLIQLSPNQTKACKHLWPICDYFVTTLWPLATILQLLTISLQPLLLCGRKVVASCSVSMRTVLGYKNNLINAPVFRLDEHGQIEASVWVLEIGCFHRTRQL